MSNTDGREGASDGQPKLPRKRSSKTPRNVRPPVIEPGGIYAGQDLICNIRIDPAELRRLNSMDNGGLYPLDTNTREEFYSADDVINYWLNRPRKKKARTSAPKTPRTKRK